MKVRHGGANRVMLTAAATCQCHDCMPTVSMRNRSQAGHRDNRSQPCQREGAAKRVIARSRATKQCPACRRTLPLRGRRLLRRPAPRSDHRTLIRASPRLGARHTQQHIEHAGLKGERDALRRGDREDPRRTIRVRSPTCRAASPTGPIGPAGRRKKIRDAVRLHIEGLLEDGLPVPQPSTTADCWMRTAMAPALLISSPT